MSKFLTVAKKAIKKPFHLFGLELVRQGSWVPKPSSPPEALDHPIESLYTEERLSIPRLGPAFLCNLNQCTTREGFGYGGNGWHPFVAALVEYRKKTIAFEGSVLEKYYDAFCPKTASDRILDQHLTLSKLSALDPWAFVAPWETGTSVEQEKRVAKIVTRENKREGYPDLKSNDGVPGYGPVSNEKGVLEYRRLLNVLSSIRRSGYIRKSGWDGDIGGFLLRRNNEYRFLVDYGFHRLAAVAALGKHSVPVRIIRPVVIEARDVNHWPQVKRGLYTPRDALRYFHYLFDFDSVAWARAQNLLEQSYLE